MPATYEPIATTTLGSAASTISFSSIPGTYTDLVLIGSPAFASGASDVQYKLNGDTGNNFSETGLSGTGSSAVSFRATSQVAVDLDAYGVPDATLGNSTSIANFMNYSNTTTFKTSISRAGNAVTGRGTDLIVGLWRNTAAITTILIDPSGATTFATGTTYTLYGIKAA